jgi:hypothetical protein
MNLMTNSLIGSLLGKKQAFSYLTLLEYLLVSTYQAMIKNRLD